MTVPTRVSLIRKIRFLARVLAWRLRRLVAIPVRATDELGRLRRAGAI